MAGGRPSKLTEETITDLENAIRLGASDADACAYAGIDDSTFYKWMQRGRESLRGEFFEFFERLTRARARGKVGLLAKIEQAATDGDWRAAAWKLERRDPSSYGPLVKHRIGGDSDAPPVEIMSHVSDAELLRELTGILDTARAREIAAHSGGDALPVESDRASESTSADW